MVVIWTPERLSAKQRLYPKDQRRAPGTIGVVHHMLYSLPVVVWGTVDIATVLPSDADTSAVYDALSPAVVLRDPLPRKPTIHRFDGGRSLEARKAQSLDSSRSPFFVYHLK